MAHPGNYREVVRRFAVKLLKETCVGLESSHVKKKKSKAQCVPF
jgi:hypothetical protein